MKTTTIIFAFVIAFCVGMLALQAALARMGAAGLGWFCRSLRF